MSRSSSKRFPRPAIIRSVLKAPARVVQRASEQPLPTPLPMPLTHHPKLLHSYLYVQKWCSRGFVASKGRIMIGRRIKRREDPRLLRGKGQYIADLRLPGMLHAAFVRSIYAHARILDVDISVAQHMPGVVAIFKNPVCSPLDVEFARLPLLFPHPALEAITQQPLSREVSHVGEPVVMVIADSRYHAEDACEAVQVSYETLDAVITTEA